MFSPENIVIYIIAVLLGLVTCVLSFIFEVTSGNIGHLKNNREPNAGAAVFPLFPMLPLLALGLAWILYSVIPDYATWALLGLFFVMLASWMLSFRKLRRELELLSSASEVNTPPEQ